MFKPPFLCLSLTEVSSVAPEKAFSVSLEATKEDCSQVPVFDDYLSKPACVQIQISAFQLFALCESVRNTF